MALRGSLAPIGEAEVVLGIDLGTHYSTAGAWLRNKLYLAPDERGEVCIPSVVHVPAGRDLVVGAEAERLRLSDPATTIAGVKRLLGRKRTDGSVRLFEAQSAVPLSSNKDGELSFRARGRDLSAVEVASAIFRYLRERMEVRLGGSIHRAVITVPVATTKAAREATARAARMAGLEVLRVMAEPCAAAVALSRPSGQERRVLVYDFGGGTFDAAVVTVRGDSLTVQAAGGDDCLGGDDLDEALARSISSHLWQSARVDVTKDAVRWPRLLRHSERVKRALSTAERTRFRVAMIESAGREDAVHVRGLLDDGGERPLVHVFAELLADRWSHVMTDAASVHRRLVVLEDRKRADPECVRVAGACALK